MNTSTLSPAQRAWQTRREKAHTHSSGVVAKTSSVPFSPFLEVKLTTVRVLEELPEKCDCPQLARDFWQKHVTSASWFDSQKEALVAVMLNTRMKATSFHLVSLGSINESIAHPREILRPAVVAAAYGVLLMHNHPTGDPSPSEADRSLTRRLREACEILRIQLCDHVVVGDPAVSPSNRGLFSFRESGML